MSAFGMLAMLLHCYVCALVWVSGSAHSAQ
jgi:hypothetical protein